jgi:hypothetical protein
MPANLPPQYHAAYQKYREAKTLEEKISALKEMYAVMPKHKGTDKLQADIKRKIAQLKEELQIQKQKRRGVGFVLPKREGAGQVVLVGPPNCGKSSILKVLTNAEPEIADYPFTTTQPNIGMMPYEDIQIQIIDLPPFGNEEVPWWQREIVRASDLVVLIVDLGDDNFWEQLDGIRKYFESKNIYFIGKSSKTGEEDETLEGPVVKKTILVGNKIDLSGVESNFEVLKNKMSSQWKIISISAPEKINLEELKKLIFEELDIIRIYTKQPGAPADLKDPLILPKGATVLDAGEKLHKDFARKLKYARIWGSAKFDGQRVPRDYVLQDKDIIEFHI